MKIDLHVHTAEVSACGILSAEETVRLYKEAGYDALVITNHYASYNKRRFEAAGLDFFTEYRKGFALAAAAGEKYGLKIFCGYEIRFDENENDYLVYGMDDETAARCDEIFPMTPSSFSSYAKERGILFYQAHPFRNRMTVVRPDYLFGIEVRNGNPRHDSRNDIASAWADRYPHLHRIGGSDCHQIEDVGIGGILTEREVGSMEELVEILKKDEYRLL